MINSCQTVLDIDIPEQDSKIVFNGIVVTSDTLNIFRLTKSKGVLDSINYQFDTLTGSILQFEPVTDGEIILYENDIPVETLQNEFIYAESDYPSQYKVQEGKTYRVDASGGGLPSVSASTTVPFAVVPLITSYIPDAFTDKYGAVIAELKFSINDPATEQNYYALHINSFYNGFSGGIIYFNSDDPALNTNTSFELTDGFSGVGEASFDDHLFNGENRSFTLNMHSYELSQISHLVLELSSMDRSAYLYNQSRLLQAGNEGNPFAEPSSVFNNIENGYGIFGSLVVARDTI